MDGCVVEVDDVEDDGVVGGIEVVAMAKPVACPMVDFDVSNPGASVDFDFGVEEVGPGIGVESAGVDDLQALSVDGGDVGRCPESVLPDVLHESFHVAVEGWYAGLKLVNFF